MFARLLDWIKMNQGFVVGVVIGIMVGGLLMGLAWTVVAG